MPIQHAPTPYGPSDPPAVFGRAAQPFAEPSYYDTLRDRMALCARLRQADIAEIQISLAVGEQSGPEKIVAYDADCNEIELPATAPVTLAMRDRRDWRLWQPFETHLGIALRGWLNRLLDFTCPYWESIAGFKAVLFLDAADETARIHILSPTPLPRLYIVDVRRTTIGRRSVTQNVLSPLSPNVKGN